MSSDERVLVAALTADCGTALQLTGIAPGDAHVDLLDGEALLGRWDMDVAAIHHLAIVHSDAASTARQDPPSLAATVGEPLELVAYAYDAEGHALFADPDPVAWESATPSVLSVDDPAIGRFSAHAAGTARVTVVLAGASATATVVVSAM